MPCLYEPTFAITCKCVICMRDRARLTFSGLTFAHTLMYVLNVIQGAPERFIRAERLSFTHQNKNFHNGIDYNSLIAPSV